MKYAHQTSGFGTMFSTLAALTSPAQEFVTSRPSYPALPGLRLRGDLWRQARAALEAARQRGRLARDRRALQHLDDRLLRDIGLSRADVGEELHSPFLTGRGLWQL
ncbi:MAG: hypothetical protein K0R41_4360 [Geminicoccaceae bacterium]|jgi:uncharacterized protein YjiS (DUF1127 family)|nr:hypothetical protein [Geminicoccaceae bacterium]MCE3250535.1 hypothetical protein [Geminicoccaceae bacterium]